MACNNATKLHALLVPLPLQGHLTPAVHLAFKLASKGFVVTFVNAEAKHQRISKCDNSSSSISTDIFEEARSAGFDIRYELVTDGVPDFFDVNVYVNEIYDMFVQYIPAHVEKVLQRSVTERYEDRISCLITDTFYNWPATMAKKFRIPFVSFWTESATTFSLYYHAQLLINNGHFDCQENERVTVTYIPGIPSIEPTDLISYFQEPNPYTETHQVLLKAFEETKQAEFVISNTVQELEPYCIDAMQQQQPFFAIGPTIRYDFISSSIKCSLWPESDCSKWLDMQPHASVIYISFGSLFKPSKRDFQEIMHGALGSKARFLWVCPPETENSGEFDELLKVNEDQGMIVRWCSQKEVLEHPAVGLFMTHCGWNSILESIWCEVPMLCFPLFTDQFTNRKLVVKDWKVGLDIGPINEIKRDQVSIMIDSVIGPSEVQVALKNKIKGVKQVIQSAISPSGSSTKNFEHFVDELVKLDSKI